jgi:predicted RND superfamily exporter protein
MSAKLSESFLTKDKRYSKLSLNLPTGTVHEMKLMLDKINRRIHKELIGTSIEISPAGFLPLYIEQVDTIVKGMMSGLALAIILILIVMIILVKDFKLGIITITVTILPLFALVILMKIFNIYFDVGTAIIFSVVIGMIADDALHIIWNYKQTIKENRNDKLTTSDLFALSVRKIIYPCIITSIMFSVGFSVLIFSRISIIENFGILSAATILLAWVSDFFIFPALLNIFYYSKKNRA